MTEGLFSVVSTILPSRFACHPPLHKEGFGESYPQFIDFSFVLIYEYVLHLDMQNYGFGFVTVLAALDVLFSAGRAVSYPLIITDSDSPFHDTWKMIKNLGSAWLIYQLIRVLPILIFYKNGIEMINWIRLGIGTLLRPLWYNFEYNFYITALNTEKSR